MHQSTATPWTQSLLVGTALVLLLTCCGQAPTANTQEELPILHAVPITPGVQLTANTVLQYVGTSEFEGGPTVSGGPPTILICRAMMSKDLEKLIHTQVTADNRPVIYVKLQGPFILTGAPVPGNLRLPPVERVNEAFDARTGDVLLWGVTA